VYATRFTFKVYHAHRLNLQPPMDLPDLMSCPAIAVAGTPTVMATLSMVVRLAHCPMWAQPRARVAA
jgi:hypothetical protein